MLPNMKNTLFGASSSLELELLRDIVWILLGNGTRFSIQRLLFISLQLRLTLSFDEKILFFDLNLSLADAQVYSVRVVIMFWLYRSRMPIQAKMQVLFNVNRFKCIHVFEFDHSSVIIGYGIDLPKIVILVLNTQSTLNLIAKVWCSFSRIASAFEHVSLLRIVSIRIYWTNPANIHLHFSRLCLLFPWLTVIAGNEGLENHFFGFICIFSNVLIAC